MNSYSNRIIAVFCLGWALIYADRTALFPLLPAIAADLRLSGTQSGAIASAYFLAYVILQPLFGVVADRLGLKRVLVAMVFVAGLGLLGMALVANSYGLLLLFMALHGLGAGVYYPGAYAISMYTVPPSRRGLSSAIINSGMSLGLGLGLAASGPLYVATSSWRAPYLAMALPTICFGVLLIVAVRGIQPQRPSLKAIGRMYRDRTLLCLDAAQFCSLYGFWAVVTWGPTFFQTERGLGIGTAGIYTALVALAALPAALALGSISDRLGRRRVCLILLPLAAAAIVALATVQSTVGLVVALIAYGLVGNLVFGSITVSWVGDRVSATAPQAMGAAMGIFNLSGMLSAVVAPLVSGWLLDLTGSLEASFYLGAAVVVAGVLFVALARDAPANRPPGMAEAPRRA